MNVEEKATEVGKFWQMRYYFFLDLCMFMINRI